MVVERFGGRDGAAGQEPCAEGSFAGFRFVIGRGHGLLLASREGGCGCFDWNWR